MDRQLRAAQLGVQTPSPPPSIMAGPPIAMVELAVAMITSQHARRAVLPAKQRPDVIPTSGTRPLSIENSCAQHIGRQT